MKYATSVYKPSLLIRDITAPAPQYYRSSDVSWSPLTKLSSFDQKAVKPSVIRPRVTAKRSLFHDVTAITTLNPTALKTLQATPFSDVTPREMPLHTTKTHVQMLPKKYSLANGVSTDLNRPTFKLSAAGIVVAFILFLGMLGFSPASTPSSGSDSSPQPRTAAPSALTVPTSNDTNNSSSVSSTATPSTTPTFAWTNSGTASSTSAGSSDWSAPVGGYGGGSSDTTADSGSTSSDNSGGETGDNGGTTDPGTGGDDGADTPTDSSDPVITIPPIVIDPTGSTPIIQTGSINVL